MPRVSVMSASVPVGGREQDVLAQAIAALRELLPTGWVVEAAAPPPGTEANTRKDAVVHIREPQGLSNRVIVEVKRTVAPRDVETLLGGRLPLLRTIDPFATVAVVAPWLSPRSRALLAERDIGYLDLTGNVRLQLERPAVVIRTNGAQEDPEPRARGTVSIRGAIAGRVVRLLTDVRPPYTASALARVGGVSIPYVSRLLAALDREALVQRGGRSLVVDVDWPNLLRRRAETYRLYGTNVAQGFVSGSGARDTARRLRAEPVPYRAVTGSFAAGQRAPVAAPGQLTVYVDDPDATAEALGLLPTEQGADVVLLLPYDAVVLERAEMVDGLRVVAPSQVAVDCLAGNGRMPAEGDALLVWMAEDETRWRLPDLDRVAPRGEIGA